MSTVFSENDSAIPDKTFVIVPRSADNSMPKQTENALGEYVRRAMQENGQNYESVVKMSKRRGGDIGKSTIQQIVTGGTTNPGIFTVRDLAWGLNRPVEDLLSAAYGVPLMETEAFKNTEFANLADMYRQMPPNERRGIKRYCLQVMEREFRLILTQLSDSE